MCICVWPPSFSKMKKENHLRHYYKVHQWVWHSYPSLDWDSHIVSLRLTSWTAVSLGFHVGHSVLISMFILCWHFVGTSGISGYRSKRTGLMRIGSLMLLSSDTFAHRLSLFCVYFSSLNDEVTLSLCIFFSSAPEILERAYARRDNLIDIY